MKKQIFSVSFTAILLLSCAAGIVLAAESQPADIQAVGSHYSQAPWFIRYVHHPAPPDIIDVGEYNSVAFNPTDGLPYISYYNATHHDLLLASPNLSGTGNCGNEHDWWCRAVDGDGLEGRSTDDTGQYSSIAFWKNSIDDENWKLGISYYDATTHGLRFAEWRCQGGCTWIYHSIATGTDNYFIGWYTSLHYDSNGNPHIAYYANNNLGADTLNYTTYVGGGTGNCGPSDDWWCSMVDSGTGVGKWASLDIRYDDTVYIAYYHGGLGELRYAYNAGIGNCGTGDAWYCTTIDSDGYVGAQASFLAPSYAGDYYRVAYYDLDYHHLKYAHSGMGGSGNCGPSNSWACSVVDDMNAYLPVGISMQVDAVGTPMIAYQYTDPTNPAAYDLVRLARPNYVYDGTNAGNCGDIPPGYTDPFWRCITLDNASLYEDEGDFISMAVDGNGLAAISYAEENSFYNTTFLKVVFQRARLFLPIIRR